MRRLLAATLLPLLFPLCGCDTSVTVVDGGTGNLRGRFVVVAVDPGPGAIEVGPLSEFRVTLSRSVDRDLSPELVISVLLLPDEVLVSGRLRFEPGPPVAGEPDEERVDRVIVWSPETPIEAGRRFRLEIAEDIVSVDGDELGSVAATESGDPLPATFETFANPPVLRGEVRAQAASSTSIEANWDAAVDDVTSTTELVYEIFTVLVGQKVDLTKPAFRSDPGRLEGLVVGLRAGTEYAIFLRALDALGNASALSKEIRATTDRTIDVEAPSFDGIVELEAISPTELRVAWAAASDDVDPAELLRYNVYLATESGAQEFDGACLAAPGGLCQTSLPGAVESILGELEPDTSFFVVVRAQDTAGNESQNLEELEVETPISFASQVLPLLTHPVRGCTVSSSCHSGETPRDDLNLESYAGLIEGGRSQRLGIRPPMVVPGEAISDDMQSYFLWRTDTTNANFEGPRMPLGRSPWTSSQLGTLKRWILQGALDN